MRLKTNVMVQRYFFLIYFYKFLKRKEKKISKEDRYEQYRNIFRKLHKCF